MKTKIKTYPYRNLANNKIKKLHHTMSCLSKIRQLSLQNTNPQKILHKLDNLEKKEYQNINILKSIRNELKDGKSISYLEDEMMNLIYWINNEIKDIIEDKDTHSRKEKYISNISSISKTE